MPSEMIPISQEIKLNKKNIKYAPVAIGSYNYNARAIKLNHYM